MWESDHQEDWVPKNPCFWTVVLEKTLESPLDCKEIKQVNLTGNQPWIFIGKTDAEDEASILWLPDAKSRLTDANSRLTGKDPDAAKDWQQEGKWVTEDEMVGWHHWLNGHEFEQTPGDSESPVLKGGLSAMLSLRRSLDAVMTQTWVQNDPNVSTLKCVSIMKYFSVINTSQWYKWFVYSGQRFIHAVQKNVSSFTCTPFIVFV